MCFVKVRFADNVGEAITSIETGEGDVVIVLSEERGGCHSVVVKPDDVDKLNRLLPDTYLMDPQGVYQVFEVDVKWRLQDIEETLRC